MRHEPDHLDEGELDRRFAPNPAALTSTLRQGAVDNNKTHAS
jgi:hypothetical protein